MRTSTDRYLNAVQTLESIIGTIGGLVWRDIQMRTQISSEKHGLFNPRCTITSLLQYAAITRLAVSSIPRTVWA